MNAAATNAVSTSETACAVAWVYTEGVGYSAILPDRRIAHIQPTKSGRLWLLRICKRMGRRVADLYVVKPTPEECQRVAEYQGRRAAA